MDIQRIIALSVFAFSSLLLWEAWQKHNAPKAPLNPPSAAVQAGVPAAGVALEAGKEVAVPKAGTPAAAPAATPAPIASTAFRRTSRESALPIV
jgi:YidC/Oxa1 family membrane protein insertase